MKDTTTLIPEERIVKHIVLLRGEKVLLDVHLAALYEVETRVLKQAVKRNPSRFPADFMYELTEEEIGLVVSQHVIPHKKYFGGATPYAFTEAGVAMLSSVLKSERAVEMNVIIIRTFIALRKVALHYKELMSRLEEMKKEYDTRFMEVFTAMDYLLNPPKPEKNASRRRIGFKNEELL